jgi:hypothetical protein
MQARNTMTVLSTEGVEGGIWERFPPDRLRDAGSRVEGWDASQKYLGQLFLFILQAGENFAHINFYQAFTSGAGPDSIQASLQVGAQEFRLHR